MKHLIKFSLLILIGATLIGASEYVNGDYAWWEWRGSIILGLIFIWTPIIDAHALKESKRIRKGTHVKITLWRGFWMALSACLIVRPWDNPLWMDVLGLFIYQWGIFAVQFDLFYAYHADQKALYLGDQAFQDRLFRKYPIALFMIDILWMITGILIFIK